MNKIKDIEEPIRADYIKNADIDAYTIKGQMGKIRRFEQDTDQRKRLE